MPGVKYILYPLSPLKNDSTESVTVQYLQKKYCYCSLVIFREVFFVSEGHRKPETYRANLCD